MCSSDLTNTKNGSNFIDLKDVKQILGEVTKDVKTTQVTQNTKESKTDLKSMLDMLKTTTSTDTTSEVKTEQKVDIASLLKSSTLTQKNQTVSVSDVKNEMIKNLSESVEKSENKDLTKTITANESETDAGGSEDKSNDSSTNLTREVIKNAQQSLKPNQLKQTFSTFAQEFKEQVQNYKAPLTRVNLTLNPNNLGEVEVSIVSRGNNLNVTFTSTNQTLSLFIQNQTEFKNSLVNMGFTELEMNFSEKQRDGQQQQQNGKNSSKFFNEEQDDEISSIELTLPNYA